MRIVDVYRNLTDYEGFEFKAYQLQKSEADICAQALKKQIPERPKMRHAEERTIVGFCPICAGLVGYVIPKDTEPDYKNYCKTCGQLINWRP